MKSDRHTNFDDLERKVGKFALVPFNRIALGRHRRSLVKGLVPRIGLTVVWGPPKSGKSFVVFDMMMHVSLGWEYRGRRVHAGPVVYCAFEGQAGIEARVEAFRQTKLTEDGSEVPFYLQPTLMSLVRDHVALIDAIKVQLGDSPPVAVVLDTLNRSLDGSESNDEDMSAYVAAADAIRDAFRCAVIIVHHCGVEGTRPRGHTSLSGATDAQLAVRREGDLIVLKVEMMKDGEQGTEIVSRLETIDVGTDEDGDAITSCIVIPADGEVALSKAKSPSLPKAAKIALRALEEAITEAGNPAPTSNHIPQNVSAVSLNLWREYSYQRGISASDAKPRARQAAFKRATEHLIAAKVVATWDDHVWLCR